MLIRAIRRRSGALAAALLLAAAALLPAWAAGGGAVASAHPLATAAGEAMLARGGNAFDAAVAVAAALAVVEPYSSGLGGGGFFLLHRASDGWQTMVDARETAPAGARREHYLDAGGEPVRGATTQGGTAAAIPGLPAALVHVAQRYGALPLGETLAPALRLARDGHAVDARYARIAQLRERFLQSQPEAARIFLDAGRAPRPGYLLRQPELAATLERLAAAGRDGFYRGPVARALVAAANAAGGAWSKADLAGYRVIERRPLSATYRGATVTTAALPSAGGVALVQSLAMLERFALPGVQEPPGAHLVVEALRRAFQDRALHLGDPDFTALPLARLLDRGYLHARAAGIDPGAASRSEALPAGPGARAESGNTTHLSVIDAAGNRVGATLTINWLFGSGIVAPGTGVLLNNEMDDFTLRADVPNSYQLRGSEANAIAPGRRPLSSMTPTFVEDARGVLVLGAPGGSRIVSMVLLAVLQHLETPQVDLQRLVAAPRYHHQWWPDRLEVEPDAYPPPWHAAMRARGHALQVAGRRWGNLQAVFRARDGATQAASDPRGSDVAWY